MRTKLTEEEKYQRILARSRAYYRRSFDRLKTYRRLYRRCYRTCVRDRDNRQLPRIAMPIAIIKETTQVRMDTPEYAEILSRALSAIKQSIEDGEFVGAVTPDAKQVRHWRPVKTMRDIQRSTPAQIVMMFTRGFDYIQTTR